MAVLNITDAEFEAKVIKANGYILVDFWANWCNPCKQLAPILNVLSEEFANKLTIAKVNIDENPDTPTKYGVRGIPTLILFKDGKAVSTKVGSTPKSGLIDWLNSEIA